MDSRNYLLSILLLGDILLDILTYIAQGASVTETVKLFVDRQSLLEYRALEDEINKSRDSEHIRELEERKAELRNDIDSGALVLTMKLPDRDKRQGAAAILESELKIDTESLEFQSAITDTFIGLSITEIVSPVGTQAGPLTREETAALRESLQDIPDNWLKVVAAYNNMVHEELLTDVDMSSPDFS